MKEIVLDGDEIENIIVVAMGEDVSPMEYNSFRFWHQGLEIFAHELEAVIYIDEEDN